MRNIWCTAAKLTVNRSFDKDAQFRPFGYSGLEDVIKVQLQMQMIFRPFIQTFAEDYSQLPNATEYNWGEWDNSNVTDWANVTVATGLGTALVGPIFGSLAALLGSSLTFGINVKVRVEELSPVPGKYSVDSAPLNGKFVSYFQTHNTYTGTNPFITSPPPMVENRYQHAEIVDHFTELLIDQRTWLTEYQEKLSSLQDNLPSITAQSTWRGLLSSKLYTPNSAMQCRTFFAEIQRRLDLIEDTLERLVRLDRDINPTEGVPVEHNQSFLKNNIARLFINQFCPIFVGSKKMDPTMVAMVVVVAVVALLLLFMRKN